MEYIVVHSNWGSADQCLTRHNDDREDEKSGRSLEEMVQKLLDEGWKLHGGVGVGHGEHSRGSGCTYAQVMVRGKYPIIED